MARTAIRPHHLYYISLGREKLLIIIDELATVSENKVSESNLYIVYTKNEARIRVRRSATGRKFRVEMAGQKIENGRARFNFLLPQ